MKTHDRGANPMNPSEAEAETNPPLPQRYEDVHRVLTNLFSDLSGRNVKVLRDALLGTSGSVEEVLTSLNSASGKSLDPRFNQSQREGLKAFLTERKFSPISPIGAYAEPGNRDKVSHQVMIFWRELMSKQPGEVADFHIKVSDYAANPNDPSKFQAVLDVLNRYSKGNWERGHVEALAAINTHEIEFKSLVWFPFPGNIW